MPSTVSAPDRPDVTQLAQDYTWVRNWSHRLCEPLVTEDYVVQTMPDVSPPKWHLAHTTWFFETFLLQPYLQDYNLFHPQYGYLFNSYYEAVGDRHPRPQRGLLSRPTVEDVYRNRAYVDEAMQALMANRGEEPKIIEILTLGLHHEQQHQELLLTDIKHILANNPLKPAYHADEIPKNSCSSGQNMQWLDGAGGVQDIGFAGDGFAFDNESPLHRIYLQDYQLGDRLVTNGEYLEFIEAGGYHQASHWLSEGWYTVQKLGWQAPLYWQQIDQRWWVMTLAGLKPLDLNEPVCHVSYFEAEAYATWRGDRLPTEAEWELVARHQPVQGNLLDTGRFHPVAASTNISGKSGPMQLFGDVWEWTQSAYLPYPGYRPPTGAIGEYNGKFMCNQMVLRGGSCATPATHIRATYRNFFPSASRWQFSGIRLAR